jgi:hypothetical protein
MKISSTAILLVMAVVTVLAIPFQDKEIAKNRLSGLGGKVCISGERSILHELHLNYG